MQRARELPYEVSLTHLMSASVPIPVRARDGAAPTPLLREFERVVQENHDRIYRAACLLIDHRVDAEDLTQSVFVQAWRAWAKFEGRSQPYTWLYRILLRTYRRQQRQRWWLDWRLGKTESLAEETTATVADIRPHPDDVTARRDDCLEVRAVIRVLSPKLREVLVLRYTEDWSLAQIAEVLGIPVGTAKSRLIFAQKIVAERLKARGWK